MGFKIGVKYGIVKRIIKYCKDIPKETRGVIYKDLEYAAEELVDCIIVEKPKLANRVTKIIDDWLSLEAKMTGFKPQKYKVGDGKKIFERIIFERALYEYRKTKNKK